MGLQSIITLAGASQGIFLSMLFLLRRGRHPSMVILGVYIFLFSCGLLEHFHDRGTAGIPEKLVFSFLGNANFLYGPLIYLFIKLLRDKTLSIRAISIHFLPFAIFFAADILLIIGVLKLAPGSLADILDLLAFELFVIQLTVYSIVSLRTYKHLRFRLLNTYSNINGNDVNWMLYLLYLLTVTYLLSFAFSHLLITGLLADRSVFIIIQVLVALFTYLLGYRMFIRPAFFQLAFDSANTALATKYKRSGLKEEQANIHLVALNTLMMNDKLYKNPDITVFDMSGALNISRNHLTEILNVHAGKNFNEYVNSFRVEEAKNMLIDPRLTNLTIAGIGKEAGFKSPNAFFTNFKKMTGLTPAIWKDKYSGTDNC